MWSGERDRSLTFDEWQFVAAQTIQVTVIAKRHMPAISCPLIGEIGPFEVGGSTVVPLYVAEELAREGVALPALPEWLSEEGLQQVLSQEQNSVELQMCPHEHFIEIATTFFDAPYNPWHEQPNPSKARRNAMQLLEDLMRLRQTKLDKLNAKLINDGTADASSASCVERRRLGLIAVDYVNHIQKKQEFPEGETSIFDLLQELGFDNINDHYNLIELANNHYKDNAETYESQSYADSHNTNTSSEPDAVTRMAALADSASQ